jgi:hypothetical protein
MNVKESFFEKDNLMRLLKLREEKQKKQRKQHNFINILPLQSRFLEKRSAISISYHYNKRCCCTPSDFTEF